MIKQNKKLIIITSLITLLPLLIGITLWNRLPETMVTHWNMNNEPDGFMSKGAVVFGMPFMMVALHLVCIFATLADPKHKNISNKIFTLVLWIIPVLSLLLSAMTYGQAFFEEINVGFIVIFALGAMFTVIGNYLPKCKQSYTVGIKLPWTLSDSENWNKTHRLAGAVWVTGGVLIMLTSFLAKPAVTFGILLAMVLVPTVYSYIYYVKHKNV